MEAAADDEKESGEQSEREEAEWNANQASADYLLSKGFIEGYSDDLLGQRCCAAEVVEPIQNERGSASTAFSFRPFEAQGLFGPQAPFAPQEPDEDIDLEFAQQGPGLEVLPARKQKRTLSELDSGWDHHRERQGLHPAYPPTCNSRSPGAAERREGDTTAEEDACGRQQQPTRDDDAAIAATTTAVDRHRGARRGRSTDSTLITVRGGILAGSVHHQHPFVPGGIATPPRGGGVAVYSSVPPGIGQPAAVQQESTPESTP